MISVSDVAKSYGERTLFEGVSLHLEPGACYGLVGANGSGKSTFLRILAGDEEPSAGSVAIPRRLDVGVLRQDQFLYEDEMILEVAMRGNEVLWEAIAAKELLLSSADASGEFDVERFAELEETIQLHDGYAAEARASEVLQGLGIETAAHRRPMSTLSGGFKLRVLLAQVLVGSPDVLLLDEPTNHLDILSIRWLEKFLRSFDGPAVVISHDHRFLDNISTHVLDVDYETVTLYTGDYSAFRTAKQAGRERREKEIAEREREIAHHQEFVDRFRAKASKARQAQSRVRMIEKKAEGLVELPRSSRQYPHFRFDERRHSGRRVLSIEGVRKAFGDKQVLHGVDLEVDRGDRVAIMGPNGIGKSTLLKILVGELPADEGSVEWGYETHPGYFAQDHHEQFEAPGRTAEEWIAGFCDRPSTGFVRGELGRVLFSGDDAEKRLGDLSGGEAARLVFCRLAIERPNVLVLDEPTNHLDLEAIEALVEALQAYDGTLILVSHDRWFVSRLATRVVEIKADDIRDFRGSYDEYVHACGDDHLDVDTVVLKAQEKRRESKRKGRASDAPSGNGSRRPAELRARRDEVTARIDQVETRLGEIAGVFADPDTYESVEREELARLDTERGDLETELASLLADWETIETELSETG